jgi:Tol biopolymer transport system component/DNA-binding winged helix-turn-helix (wHTH) protein
MHSPLPSRRTRFGPFELDVRTGELRKGDVRLRVPDQSIRILRALLERAGDIVTREELRAQLWPADTFVDFDHGLNSAVRRLRDVLGDSADAPKFIETLPRRGYRFIGTIEDAAETVAPAPAPAPVTRDVDNAWPAAVVSSDAAPPDASSVSVAIGPPARRRRWLVAAATFLTLALSVAALSGRWPERRDADATWPDARRLTFEDGLQTTPNFSPDGQSIAYAGDAAGNFDIWTQRVAGGNPVHVTTHAADDWQPDWSPDGNTIVFRSERGAGGLFLVPATGGIETPLTDFGHRPQWSPDGRFVLFTRSMVIGSGPRLLYLVRVSDHELLPLPPMRTNGAFGWLDSRTVVLMSASRLPPFAAHLASTDVETQQQTEWTVEDHVTMAFRQHEITVPGGGRLYWSPDRRAVFFVGDAGGTQSVWRLVVDAAAHRVVDGPIRVTNAMRDANDFTVSRDGTRFAFDGSTRTARLWQYELDGTNRIREDRGRAISLEAADTAQPDLSRDGTRLVFQQTLPGGGQRRALIVRDMITGKDRPLHVFDGTREVLLSARWSPSGRLVSYAHITRSASGNRMQLRVMDPATNHDVDIASPTGLIDFPTGWTLDERFVVMNGQRYVDGKWAVAQVPLDAAPNAETAARIVTTSKGDIFDATVSPDGRWIAFRARIQLRGHVTVVSADGGDESSWIDAGDGIKPHWSTDGTVLYFTRNDGATPNVWAVGFDRTRGRVIGTRSAITAFNGPGAYLLPNIGMFDLAVGGNHLVVPVVRPKGGIWIAEREGR